MGGERAVSPAVGLYPDSGSTGRGSGPGMRRRAVRRFKRDVCLEERQVEDGHELRERHELDDGAKLELRQYAHHVRRNVLVVDARSLCDFASRDTGKTPTDRRLAVDLRLMQEYMTRSNWVPR